MVESKVIAVLCALLIAIGLGVGLGVGLGSANNKNSCPSSSSSSLAVVPDLHAYQWIDLTHEFNNDTVFWPTSPTTFQLDVLAYGETERGYFYASNAICLPEHGGTHLDAPIHFSRDQWTTEEIPLEKLNGPGFVIDVTDKAALDPDYRLSLEDIADFESKHGQTIPANSVVLLRTGWGLKYPNRLEYLGDDTENDASNLHFPSFGEDAANYLVERGVSLIGVDTASIDYGPSTDFIVHQIVNGNNIPGLENVANLEKLPPTGSWIVALPMKIGSGSGGPARIVALVPS